MTTDLAIEIEPSANDRTFQRAAGIAAIISAPLALLSLFAALPAVDWNFDTMTDMMLFLKAGARGAAAGRASMLFDMFGYYLLIAPATYCLGRRLERRSPVAAGFFTKCVLVYVAIGAAGAAILAAALPALMNAYSATSGADRTTIEVVYRAVTDSIYGGLWNILEEIAAGVGWLGLGWLLRAEGQRKLGALTLALGSACVLDGVGNMFGVSSIADPGLYVYLVLAPAWAVCLGLGLRQRRSGISA